MRYKFFLYAQPDDNSPDFLVSEGYLDAKDKQEARNKAMDEWDDRLDASGCRPRINLYYAGKSPSGKIQIDLNVDEDEQMSSRQNAALHGAPGDLAISIDACPAIPEDLTSQDAIAEHLKKQLDPLVNQGWTFEIAIGPASE